MKPYPFMPTTTPVQFSQELLGMASYPWQEEVLTWFNKPNQRVMGGLMTPNGAGKSSGVVAALALWWVTVYKRGKVVVTTKDGKQLDQQLYPAFERYRGRMSGWSWVTSPYSTITTPTGSKIVAFTTNHAGRAEGWHKEDDLEGPLLFIVDEAKSVEEDIFEAIDRCTFNSLLYVSSPGLMMGAFYNAFTRNAALFKRRQVSLAECPHIPRERIEGMIAKYGEKHPLVRSSVYGEFMDQDEATAFVFPLGLVQRALQHPPRSQQGSRSAFCDFAAGGDENVLALRTGNRVEIAAAWRERDTMASVGRFAMEFRKADLEPAEIFADEGGLGKPMIDALWRAGWEVNRVNNGARAFDPSYEDRGAELWHETAAALTRGEIVLPQDDDLVAQLTTRRARITSDGRLGLEPKKELSRRGLPSPDRADALCGAWGCRPLPVQARHDLFEEWRERFTGPEPGEVPAGMQAG